MQKEEEGLFFGSFESDKLFSDSGPVAALRFYNVRVVFGQSFLLQILIVEPLDSYADLATGLLFVLNFAGILHENALKILQKLR